MPKFQRGHFPCSPSGDPYPELAGHPVHRCASRYKERNAPGTERNRLVSGPLERAFIHRSENKMTAEGRRVSVAGRRIIHAISPERHNASDSTHRDKQRHNYSIPPEGRRRRCRIPVLSRLSLLYPLDPAEEAATPAAEISSRCHTAQTRRLSRSHGVLALTIRQLRDTRCSELIKPKPAIGIFCYLAITKRS